MACSVTWHYTSAANESAANESAANESAANESAANESAANEPLAKALNELFHAHEYVFHHGAHGLVYKGRDGNHVVGFGQLQFEIVVKLNGMAVRLHVDRDVGIVGVNLIGAPGDQVSQLRLRGLGNVHATHVNDLALTFSQWLLVG